MNSSEASIDVAMLDRMLAAGDHHIAIETLAQTLALPIPSVLDRLNQLIAMGCQFDTHPQWGVRLVHTGLSTWADYLQAFCHRHVQVYRRTGSTQDVVRKALETQGLAARDLVVIADEQTQGRGRMGRQWFCPPGQGAMFSLAVVHDENNDSAMITRLTLCMAVALSHAVLSVTDSTLPVGIKWPNDILVEGRKLAGVLVERFTLSGRGVFVIGVGLNVSLTAAEAPAALGDAWTSLARLGHHVDRLTVLKTCLTWIDRVLTEFDDATLQQEWRQRNTLTAERVSLMHNGQRIDGHVIDVDPRAGLIVQSETGAIVHLPAAGTSVL